MDKKNTDLIAYSEIYQIILKNRFKLIIFFVVSFLISTFLILLIPVEYKITGSYRTPVRAFFDDKGYLIEQPFENIEFTISKFHRTTFFHSDECRSFFYKSSINGINSKVFEIQVIDTDLDCAKKKFETILSTIKEGLINNEEKLSGLEKELFSNYENFYHQKSLKGPLILANLTHSPSTIISFSEEIPVEISKVEKNWIKIFKYIFLMELIIIFLYILQCIIKKAVKA